MKITWLSILGLVVIGFIAVACFKKSKPALPPAPSRTVQVPEWAKNANIYEVNIRQYTPEGTLSEFIPHISRLKDMGVKILWLMPINPISVAKRKGSLGSYYAVNSYRKVNPEFGNLEDFDLLVKTAHAAGMYIILDWVPNHTGWDHEWITAQKDYYTQDAQGNVIDPIDPATGTSWGWTDVADLNYDNHAMRAAMIEEMKYWVINHDIDGFRCDVAHNVPVDFWETCTDSLYKIKPLFMLAEAEVPALRNTGSFVMDYAWEFHHHLNAIAQGKETVNIIDTMLNALKARNKQGYSMHFTSNHDENSWQGTEFERMGDAHKPLAVLVHTLDGMPLIYSGQEEPLKKRLLFFERDTIPFSTFSYAAFYKSLLDLKSSMPALWNGQDGATAERINTSDAVYAFRRIKDKQGVAVIINLTSQPQVARLNQPVNGTELFTGQTVSYSSDSSIKLEPWAYHVILIK